MSLRNSEVVTNPASVGFLGDAVKATRAYWRNYLVCADSRRQTKKGLSPVFCFTPLLSAGGRSDHGWLADAVPTSSPDRPLAGTCGCDQAARPASLPVRPCAQGARQMSKTRLQVGDLAQIGTRAKARDRTRLPLELGQAFVRCRIMNRCDEDLPQTDQWLQIGVARSWCDACQRVFPALCAPPVAEGHPARSG